MNSYRMPVTKKNRLEPHLPAKRVDVVKLVMVRESSHLYANRKVASPQDAYHLLREFLVEADRERLVVVCLDTKNQPTSITTCSVGTLNSSLVHPREVYKTAILSNAASIIVAHNHPSQDPTPSKEDIAITNRLKDAGELLGIDLLDHVIVTDERYVSLKEKGYM
jgi:DNA repair protein RadC